ncbi:MAG: hypothetical protein GQ546_03505 [Gammaproteobacteria bacterium]|nr:hypothetical protein [Gammaproteobacteria bacterium]
MKNLIFIVSHFYRNVDLKIIGTSFKTQINKANIIIYTKSINGICFSFCFLSVVFANTEFSQIEEKTLVNTIVESETGELSYADNDECD